MAESPEGSLRRRASRRRILAGAAGVAGSFALAASGSAQQPTATPTVPPDSTRVQGALASAGGEPSRFARLQRRVHDQVSFTPLGDLRGVITPSALHFERHHGGVPAIDPARYVLLVHGLVERPLELTLGDLQRFPAVTRVMFLECSGNGPWSATAPDATAQSLYGLTSTSEWTGVPVATILKEVGVRPEAQWALAEGMDAAVMTRSIPLDKLLDDALLAYGQNGEALRPEQGYPVRLFLPGWEGNTNVKWLRRLELGDQPWMSREETSKYTDPLPDGTSRQFTFVMEAKSLITRPSGGQALPGLGFWEISGIAWSGRGKITRVEVSTDGGQTWGDAALQEPVLPICHTRFRAPWTWAGTEAVLMSRATDETGYVQPTRAQLVAVRGPDSVYHNNSVHAWKVNRDGTVTNVPA